MICAKNWMRLGVLLISLGAFSSCKRGPHVEWCLTGPDYFACSTEKGERKLELSQVDGYKCASPMVTYAFMKACEVRDDVSDSEFCTFDAKSKMMSCPGSFLIELSKAQNYGCMDKYDLDKLKTWCNKRAK